MNAVIRGKKSVIEWMLLAVLAESSVLLEDVPGVGKTTLAKSFAASVDLQFQRVQCTPDLLPSDILGFNTFQPADGSFAFNPGPIFTNLLLVDEINRASPRTQSALLEAMAERQVTIEGTRHALPSPFLVIATQNPHGFAGTFPLPESQLDRFLFQLSMDYPDADSEALLLLEQANSNPMASIRPAIDHAQLLRCQQFVRSVHVERVVVDYLVQIVHATRNHSRLELGASTRGAQLLFRAAQARAFADRRLFVLPDDVQYLAPLVLSHRVTTKDGQPLDARANRELLTEICGSISVPT